MVKSAFGLLLLTLVRIAGHGGDLLACSWKTTEGQTSTFLLPTCFPLNSAFCIKSWGCSLLLPQQCPRAADVSLSNPWHLSSSIPEFSFQILFWEAQGHLCLMPLLSGHSLCIWIGLWITQTDRSGGKSSSWTLHRGCYESHFISKTA